MKSPPPLVQDLVSLRDTPSARVGRALILLLFGFVVFALGTHGLNLTISISALIGEHLEGGQIRLAKLRTALALLLVAAAVVLVVRWRLLQNRGRPNQGLLALPALQEPGAAVVSQFLSRFLPGLAHLQLKLSPNNSPSVSRDTLFLSLGLVPSLISMASRSKDPSREALQAEHEMREQAAFVTLAHEEFHLLCFDASTDASLRALCFVLIMSLVPIFALLLAAPLPGEFNWVIQASAPLWFPFLSWVLLWGLHGGSYLLEHLADNHAGQRLRSPEAVSAQEPQLPGLIESSTAPVFIDSRGHHPAAQERLEFVHTLESQAVGRIIFFQSVILVALSADQGALGAAEHHWGISPTWGAVRTVLLVAAASSAFGFSALAGALAPLRHASAALGVGGLLLLALFAQGFHQNLARDSPWLFLTLAPAIGQWYGRKFLRSRLAPWLRAGTAAAGLPIRVEQAHAAQVALFHALQSANASGKRPSRFQRLLDLSWIHGRFFDAAIATALSFLLVVALASFAPRLGFPLGVFLVAAVTVLLGIYFTRWPEQRSGLFLLWSARMLLLGLLLLTGALYINFDLYVRSKEPLICPMDPAQQQICIGHFLMDPQRQQEYIEPVIDMVIQRCDEAQLIPKSLKQSSASFIASTLMGLRCAFFTPGHLVGPLFLWSIVAAFFFDTVLSTLRWIGAWRRLRSTSKNSSKTPTREKL